VYFPDGRRAGQTVHERVFQEGELEAMSAAGQELACEPVLLGGGHEHLASLEERTLRLCFRAEDLRTEERDVAFGTIEDLFGAGELMDIEGALDGLDGLEVSGGDE